MKTKESENMKELYKSPSIEVIAISPESVLCQSTEGYRLGNNPLTDEDFE